MSIKNRKTFMVLSFYFIMFCLIKIILNINKSSININEYNFIMYVVFLSVLILMSIFISYKNKDLLEPITVMNIFIFFIFVARPLQVYYGDVISNDKHVFQLFNLMYGLDSGSLPFSKAIEIGLVGTLGLYLGYYTFKRTNKVEESLITQKFKKNEVEINKGILKKNIHWIYFIFFIAFLQIVIFFLRFDFSNLVKNSGDFSSAGIEIGTLSILWVHLGTVCLIFLFILRGKLSKREWLIVLLYVVLLSSIGKRTYIVNILLSLTVLMYYLQFKRKINVKFLFICIFTVIVVIFYGTIRSNSIGREISNSFLGSLLDEFSMFDMLIVSLYYSDQFNIITYNGYSFLKIFTGFIPSSLYESPLVYFDQMHTEYIFQNIYEGSIPVSFFGSMYFNFSLMGTFLGSIILGVFISVVYNKLNSFKSIYSIGIYALFTTFLYDIIRVGDIGREFWTFVVYMFVFLFVGFFISDNKKRKEDSFEEQ